MRCAADRSQELALRACAWLALTCVVASARADISLVRAGFGDLVRFGGVVPMQLDLSLPAGDSREGVDAEVVVAVPCPDGDVAEYSMRTILSGAPSALWIYPTISNDSSAELVQISLYQRSSGARGALLERVEASPTSPVRGAMPVDPAVDIVGVVEGGHCGMSAWWQGAGSGTFPLTLNGAVAIAQRLAPSELPDRAEGWSGFKAVVWCGAPLASLQPAQERALVEWIKDGGRLVLQCSASPGGFGLGDRHSEWWSTMLRGLTWTQHDDAKVSALLPVVSKSNAPLKKDATQPLVTFDAVPEPWVRLVAMPVPRASNGVADPRPDSLDGACLVVERPIGVGSIVVSGLDADALQRRRLRDSELPEADAWWNRIIGRRGDTPSGAQMRDWGQHQPSLLRTQARELSIGDAGFFNAFIGMRSTASNLTTAAILLFAVYWLLAGPLSFYLLRSRQLERFSWMAFLAIAAAFGAIAWAAGALLRQSEARGQHLTVLDGVHQGAGEPTAVVARLWASAFLPNYGTGTVSLPAGRGSVRPFAPIGDDGAFPDATRFVVDGQVSNSVTLPARATATMVSGAWSGELPSEWRHLPGQGTRPIQQTAYATRTANAAPSCYLTGTLVHRLPAALTDVWVVHVTPFRPPPPRLDEANLPTRALPPIQPSDDLSSVVLAARLPGLWSPGQEIELADVLYRDDATVPAAPRAMAPASEYADLELDAAIEARFIAPLRGPTAFVPSGALSQDTARDELLLASLYGAVPAPRWWAAMVANRAAFDSEVTVRRSVGHALDLGAWCSRPCIIVMGFMDGADDAPTIGGAPVPLFVNGEEVPMSGTTFVRVMIPLPQVDALVPATAAATPR